MANRFSRTDESIIGQWWWSVDRTLLSAILLISIFGSIMVFSASTSVADSLNKSSYYFFVKQLILLVTSTLAMIVISMLPIKTIRRLAFLSTIVITILLIITPIFGVEIKGAARWIRIFGFSLQVSEFAKPAFAVTSAWLFSTHFEGKNIPGIWIATFIFVLFASLFLIQPDLGQTIVLSTIWFSQFIVAGLPLLIIFGLLFLSLTFLFLTYLFLPHVTQRIDIWLDPSSGDTYQITKSLEAFADGAWFGVGPGNGDLKNVLPDVHSDFIFSVVGEEWGIIGGGAIISVFAFIIFRVLNNARKSNNLFVILTLVGLITQFSVQTAINLSSTMGLIPSKGMTLPYISYGGSSLVAMGVTMGIILSFTRKRFD